MQRRTRLDVQRARSASERRELKIRQSACVDLTFALAAVAILLVNMQVRFSEMLAFFMSTFSYELTSSQFDARDRPSRGPKMFKATDSYTRTTDAT